MQRLSYPTETILSNKINMNRIVLSHYDSPKIPLRRQPYLPNCNYIRANCGGSIFAQRAPMINPNPTSSSRCTPFCHFTLTDHAQYDAGHELYHIIQEVQEVQI